MLGIVPNKPLQLTPAAILVWRGSTVLQRPPQLNFAFGHWKNDATDVAGESCGVGRLGFVASCPNQPLQLTPAAILVWRGSTVLQRPPQLNFAFGHWKIDATDVAGESCGVGRLGFVASCPNQPLQLTPAAILVSSARDLHGSPAAAATELCVRATGRSMRPDVAGASCGVGRLGFVASCPNPAVAVDAGRHTGLKPRFNGSPAAAATELRVRRR